MKALHGENVEPDELHAAIFHLLRRRGYNEVPWKRSDDKDKESGEIASKVSALREELDSRGLHFPCEWLASVSQGERRRGRYWDRGLLVAEFDEIAERQKSRYPRLAEARDSILFGDCHWKEKNRRRFPVYFTSTAARPTRRSREKIQRITRY